MMRTIRIAGNRRRAKRATLATLALGAALAALLAFLAPMAQAQGSRKDDIVFGPGGHPVAGATVTVCQASATGTPCTPLASLYTDATLTVPAANPLQTDGIGNYHFYAPAGRYIVQISGPGISGTLTYRDVILAPDVSSSGSGNNISAFGLTLGGNLSVAGNAAVNGTLFVAGSTTYNGPLNINAANTGNVAGKSTLADAIQYVTPEGNDANDGLSWGTAKFTVFAACEALPGGAASPATCGSGTIYFTDLSHANPTAGAGLWLMGAADPNYASPPAGWLRWNAALSVIGVPKSGYGPNAHLGRAVLQGGSNADRNHPGVWISAISGATYIANLAVQYPGRAFVVGECSNNTRTNTCNASGITFDNTTGNLNAVAGNGPCFDLTGASFWIWLRDFGCSGLDVYNTNTDDKSAALLIDGRTNSGVGLVFVEDANTANGGIKFYAGYSGGGVFINGLTTEAQHGEPAVWLVAAGQGGEGNVLVNASNVSVADNVGVTPSFQNDLAYNTGAQITLTNMYGPVVGPASVQGQANPLVSSQIISPQRSFQTGFIGGHVYGATDLAARQFAYPTVRFANLAKTDATTWTNSGSTTFTTGITAPDGTAGAAQAVATAGQQELYFKPLGNMTLAAGDYLVGGVWVRSQTANGYAVSPPIAFSNPGGTANCTYSNAVVSGDGQWDWITTICKILTAPSNPYSVAFGAYYNTTNTIQAYGPVMAYIPVGTISDNEAYAYAAALAPYDKNCAVGTTCGLGTQLFNPIGGAIFNGTTGTPLGSTAPPYTPACLAATTCGSFLALSDLAADSFTRANAGTLGANWTVMPGYSAMSISSNAAITPSGAINFNYYTGQTFGADQFAQATLSASPASYAGVGVRVATGDNGYWFYCSTGQSYLLKRVSGTQTIFVTIGLTCATNDVLRIEVVGTQLTAYKNGVSIASASDSSLTSGTIGIEISSTGGAFQNFVGGNLKPGYNQIGYWAKMQTFGPGMGLLETTAPSGLAGSDICYGDSTAHAVKCSYNNGSFLNVPQVVASGTSALGTGAISATTCATVVTTAASGAATTDAISWSFNAAPGSGYTSGLHVLPYVTSGNVNFLVCNPTAGSLTPAAATLNWRVLR